MPAQIAVGQRAHLLEIAEGQAPGIGDQAGEHAQPRALVNHAVQALVGEAPFALRRVLRPQPSRPCFGAEKQNSRYQQLSHAIRIPMVHGDSARPSPSEHGQPSQQVPCARRAMGRGRKRHDANTPKLKMTCHNPGSIHTAAGTKRTSTRVTRRTPPTDGRNCSTAMRIISSAMPGMYAPRARLAVCTAMNAGRQRRRSNPDAQIGVDALGRIGQPQRLRRRSREREHARSGQCRRPVAAKLRAPRYLPADTADLAQRSVQVIHSRELTLQCKVHDREAACQIRYWVKSTRNSPSTSNPRSHPIGVSIMDLCAGQRRGSGSAGDGRRFGEGLNKK